MNRLQFKDLLAIYRAASFDAAGDTAKLTIDNQLILDALRISLLEENLDSSGIRLQTGEFDNLAIGQTVKIAISSPRIGLGKLAKNIDDLIQNAYIDEPRNYYLISDRFAKNDDHLAPESIQRYRKILSLVKLLKECAAYVDITASELILVSNGKFVIPIKFTWSQIQTVDLTVVDRLLKFFGEDTHKEQKLSILTNTVLSLTLPSSVGRRFSTLLTEVNDLFNKLSEGYKIFIADFSYDKVRNEFEAFRIDYSGKIHKIFSDIQNQLLTIPVATVIVATTMKPVTSGSIALTNFAVLLGAWVFAILFFLLCINQWKTLRGLDKEIQRQNNVTKEQYPTIASSFEDVFDWLEKRVRLQYFFLFLVICILVIGLASAHYFHYRLTDLGRTEQITLPKT